MQSIETQIYQRLDAMREDIIRLTQEMVAFKSVNPHFMAAPETSQEAALQDYVEKKLRSLGLELTRWEKEPQRPNLVARLPGSGGGREPGFQRSYRCRSHWRSGRLGLRALGQ